MELDMDVSIEVLLGMPAIFVFVMLIALHSRQPAIMRRRLTDNDHFNFIMLSVFWPVGLIVCAYKVWRMFALGFDLLKER